MHFHPKHLSIKNFTYELPEEQIAKYPLADRDSSKLLVYKNSEIYEKTFRDIVVELPEKTLLVFNTTRVIRARLLMERKSGARVEVFCTDVADNSVDFVNLLQKDKEVELCAFIGNGKRWKADEELIGNLEIQGTPVRLIAKRLRVINDQSVIKLTWTPSAYTLAEILDAFGKIPLPPYLNREEEKIDADRYQTVYAKHNGSVAAPTAGLHFTNHVLEKLKLKINKFAEVTLHVGAGTFKPVKADTMDGHAMHREQIIVSRELVEQILEQKTDAIVAVGTTAMRTLESLYWFGKQIITQPGSHFDSLFVSQWEPYEQSPDIPAPVALRAILDWMLENKLSEVKGYTQILIAPGYSFKIVSGLITNFHQPQSTLLLLVSAFIGTDCERVYQFALKSNFRFLSYGDSSLLWRQ
ncbi:MAG: S-adenosylmethionine:tRNA ribosyltransferase-isomerase [Bacteroidetes bacterium]|nr:S-adenosylmethionine:tRNA ribosyltransferase-isomerase [Bacteroidota bacterium]